ncbi:right-handed parallel beta-helix repeat-containing protein [Candidatus Fermentibacteria bacterium]|nr:right-handed parallel beta-helix repeat-containing protein [Candidatus Fermentibacteria bacterium]
MHRGHLTSYGFRCIEPIRPGLPCRPVLILSMISVLLAAEAEPATFTVTSTAATGAGSLREAITLANTATGLDTVAFSIPGALPTIISLTTTLPSITSPLYLDGYTQPGSAPANGSSPAIIGVQLQGSAGGTGLSVSSAGGTVRGLAIGGFITGVSINGAPGTLIEGNHIGVDAAGASVLPNGVGIRLLSGGHQIGGTLPESRNLISGNTQHGIDIQTGDWDPEPGETNSIMGNYIGADATGGGAQGNGGCGIVVTRGADTSIGGIAPGAGNVIAFNGGPGVYVAHGIRNCILSNAIFDNGGLGIDLLWDYWDTEPDGVNPNDVGDGDWGANELQNFPVLTSAQSAGSSLIITGSLNSLPNADYRVEFYSSPSPDEAGYGEGNAFVCATQVTTDASGSCEFVATSALSPALGSFISATATDALNNTSEFSRCLPFQGSTLVTTSLDSGPGSLRNAIATSNLTPGLDTISFGIPTAGAHVIRVQSPLPPLEDRVVIDGYTQNGATEATAESPAALMIEIDGSLLGGNASGLTIRAGPCTIRGLAVGGFPWCGILSEHSDSSIIAGNHLGVDGTGTALRGNGIGIYIQDGAGTVVGGSSPATKNVISGNALAGLILAGSMDSAVGNYVGTASDGTSPLGNGIGVILGKDEILGGGEPICRNVIASNNSHGVVAALSGSAVTHNWIGMTIGGGAVGNGGVGIGVGIEWLDDTLTGRLSLRAPSEDGVRNTIRENIICGSAGLGIDLYPPGPGINDAGDIDTGANAQQNYPILLQALDNQGVTVLSGELQSAPNVEFTIDFYCNDLPDPTNHGEGLVPLGSAATLTDAQGNGTVSLQVPSGQLQGRFVCCTSTDPEGNTSEFGPCLAIGGSGAVTTTADTGVGSLRMAIAAANASNDISTVTFALPGPGPHTIRPTSPLPPLLRSITVDGYTQTGAQVATDSEPAILKIYVDGTLAGENVDGLTLAGEAPVVSGIVVTGFSGCGVLITGSGAAVRGSWIGAPMPSMVANGGDGIRIEASGATVGGIDPADRCVVSANLGDGIRISGTQATGNIVIGSHIGTDPWGTSARPNGAAGIRLSGEDNAIGNGRPDGRNVISGNTGEGVVIERAGNVLRGNCIGVDATGCRAMGNASHGILVSSADDAVIGGDAAGDANIISANGGAGVSIRYGGSADNRVSGNFIGTDAAGNPVGNVASGVSIRGAQRTTVGGASPGLGNTIAFNGGAGIEVVTGLGNAFTCNSIHDNVGLGIDLGPSGVTPNDPFDVDTGANMLQNFPELAGARFDTGGTLAVWGILRSTPSEVFTVQFFWSPTADPSGYGEGAHWAGQCVVTTGSNGQADFDVSIPIDGLVHGATLSALATGASGNTSEFCLSVPIEGLPATATPAVQAFDLRQNAPNPFSSATAIEFSLPAAAFVTVDVFDAGGRDIRCLIASPMDTGAHTVTWDGAGHDGMPVAPGLYICRLQAGERRATRPMVLLR